MKKPVVVLTQSQAEAFEAFLDHCHRDSTKASITLVNLHMNNLKFAPSQAVLDELSLHDLIEAVHHGYKTKLDPEHKLQLLYDQYLKRLKSQGNLYSFQGSLDYAEYKGIVRGLEHAAEIVGYVLTKELDGKTYDEL